VVDVRDNAEVADAGLGHGREYKRTERTEKTERTERGRAGVGCYCSGRGYRPGYFHSVGSVVFALSVDP
jgi:hypothetical protein